MLNPAVKIQGLRVQFVEQTWIRLDGLVEKTWAICIIRELTLS
jgi:hypothetical protein